MYLNGADEPLAKGSVTALEEGDRLGMGAWTSITIRKVPLERPSEAWS